MIEDIQFSKGILRLAVSGTRGVSAYENYRCIKLDLSEGSAVAKLHGSEFVDLIYSVYPEGAQEVRNLVLELLSAKARVSRIDFHCFYRGSESLEGSAAPDVGVQLARRTI